MTLSYWGGFCIGAYAFAKIVPMPDAARAWRSGRSAAFVAALIVAEAAFALGLVGAGSAIGLLVDRVMTWFW